MKYHNKKVLALKFGEYTEILQKIFAAGKEDWAWNIRLVTTARHFKPYRQFLSGPEAMFVLPDLMKPQAWENDSKEVAKIEALMSASEEKVGVPINRLILAEERKIGRAYSQANYYWPDGIEARYALKDNAFPNRILRRAFYFAMSVLDDYHPDFCLGCPTTGIINAIFYYVTQYLEIPYVACMASMVIPNRHFWSTEWGSFSSDVDRVFEHRMQSQALPTQSSFDYIKRFREQPEPMPHYKKMWQDKNNQITFKNINKAIFDRFLYRTIPLIKGEKIENPKPFLQLIWNNYREFFLIRKQRKEYQSFTDEALSTFKYIYYPFHLDPEIVLNVQAPMWHNQLNTIKMLSYNLPAGYKLIVREHRYNVGRRRTEYLREINCYPGTILVDAFDNQYKYIKNADLVVTVNGTTGLEGLMLRRPVITLDRTFYDAMGLTYSFKDKKDLGALILKALNSVEPAFDHDERIALFIDAERDATLDDETASAEDEMHYIQSVLDRLKEKNDVLTEDTVVIL